MTRVSSAAPLLNEPSGATKTIRLNGPFHMWRGGELPEVAIAYETWGELSPHKDNAVLVFTGLSPGPHAASSGEDPTPGWWEYMIGPGKPIDTRRFHVICVNSLGSCFGSTGPASINPRTGRPYRLDFPELTLEDIARAGHEAVHALGIGKLHTVVGASMGGMIALAYAIQFPASAGNLVTISSATRATPFAIAMRSLQREIIRNDPAWRDGYYAAGEGPVQGMRTARKLGMVSYRSVQEWQQRFGHQRIPDAPQRVMFDNEFQVESYLERNARKFAPTFDANCYLYLLRAMDLFDIAEHGGSMAAAFAQIGTRRNLVVGVETDFLYPAWQQQEVADELKKAGRDVRFEVLPSLQGHDSFLLDEERFAPLVTAFFDGI